MSELLDGDLTITGRIMPASNHTFLAELTGQDGEPVQVVYKPTSGERPLWDFPDGTLAAREYAAYVVSEHLGWRIVPETVLRDGPAGVGMVQRWEEPDPAQDPVDLVRPGRAPAGTLHVLDAYDGRERPIELVHEDSAPLRRMAVFDAIVNNTDRKGGHILAMTDGHRYGVDHGICFHTDDKLRTVLWGWEGEPIPADLLEGVARVREAMSAELGELLGALLTPAECAAVTRRCTRLLTARTFPVRGDDGWRTIPWPPF